MQVLEYDYFTGKSIGVISSLDFGNVIQGQHCIHPLLLRAFVEPIDSSASNLIFSLTDKSSWPQTQFGYFSSPSFRVVESGDPLFSPLQGPLSLGWDGTFSDYLWLDLQTAADQTGVGSFSFQLSHS